MQRISTLYKIQEAERHLDTILFGPAQVSATSEELEATAPYPVNAPTPLAAACTLPAVSAAPATGSTPPDVAAAPAEDSVPAPIAFPEEPWLRLGAKPKAPVSSTPSQPEPWIVISDCKKRGRLSFSSPAIYDIQLENRYDIVDLHEFSLLAGTPRPPPPPIILSESSGSLPPAPLPNIPG